MLLRNAKIVTITDENRYGLIEAGAIAIKDGLIDWVGSDDAIPVKYLEQASRDLEGRLITPALIDCHTHVVYGGNRAVEFEMRLEGASYEEIARAGGGIVSTVTATRKADVDQLVKTALPRVDALLAEGVSVIEVKSGYGLDRDTELNMLRAARKIATLRPVRVKTTFLGAHATPAEFKGEPDRYIDEVCIPALHAAHEEGLVDAVDGFCEGIAFDTDQIKRVFDVARELGIPVKLHAEQLSNIGGTKLAAEYGAISVDHVEYANEDDARAMTKSGSVAVLLPGAFYTLHETQLPPIAAFRKHGVPMAVATDCNPGTSPLMSILMTMNMTCTLFRLTPEEALCGATKHAATALGLSDTGQIKAGLRADLAIWDIEHPAELSYRIGFNPLFERIFGGETVASKAD
ncbi:MULTISPECIES: imidazolonepropionase [Thalassospira]|uniref:Imidazolonepropionase n=2 Tax=Thalassospira TaxID=168934 RepID=A0A367VYS3_9PROT|nr:MULTISPECIES: imidazolonepropionase [Thalassospira]MDG4720934.1 imidazolonepropionase [Thalassospira sp. FZY0004]RCK31083.1 imidazolonepropionase [Thalassospira profundimaris]